jgi:catechol 2,3-dioxygenase-like lactoylglutathione lyase family enzyme
MSVQLNHTIVYAQGGAASAKFWAELLGLPAPTRFGPFWVVATQNDVSLDFLDTEKEVTSQHYAFLISEAEFDAVFDRIRTRGLQYWADPFLSKPGQINHGSGGRGVYFRDPNGHLLEVLTRPYGS